MGGNLGFARATTHDPLAITFAVLTHHCSTPLKLRLDLIIVKFTNGIILGSPENFGAVTPRSQLWCQFSSAAACRATFQPSNGLQAIIHFHANLGYFQPATYI